MNNEIIELSNYISSKSRDSDFHPINRHFLQPYVNEILTFNKIDFLFYNIENKSDLYSTHLMLSLPEIWNSLTADDLISIISNFTKISSYYTIIVFAYKYVEVNIIGTILNLPSINIEIKKNLLSYIENQYMAFMKNDGDYYFFENDLYGISESDWAYAKQHLLLDERIEPAFESLEELEVYINKLSEKSKNW